MVKALVLAAALGQTPQAPQAPQSPQATPQAPQAPQTPQTPQAPQAPGSSSQQSTTVVVPPPPGQAPVVVQPQQRPVEVAPCPPCPEPRVVYRDRHRRNPFTTIVADALVGGVGGVALGAAVGLARNNDTSKEWRQDLGWGAVIGFGVGGIVGSILTYVDYQDQHEPVANPVAKRTLASPASGLASDRSLTNRPWQPVVAIRLPF